MKISALEREGKKFYYADFGSETHGRTSFRLWVSTALLVAEKLRQGITELKFPCDALIHKTEKGNYMLKPSSEHRTLDIYVKCGFRGSSSITLLTQPVISVPYRIYSSPLGAIGVSGGVLASWLKSQFPIAYAWHRSGRTYGKPKEGRVEVSLDGSERELPPDDGELATL